MENQFGALAGEQRPPAEDNHGVYRRQDFFHWIKFNWVEKWLITMDLLWHAARSTDLNMPTPDFVFPKLGMDGISLPWQPMYMQRDCTGSGL